MWTPAFVALLAAISAGFNAPAAPLLRRTVSFSASRARTRGAVDSQVPEDPVTWCITRRRVRNTENGREEDRVELEPSSLDYDVSTLTVSLPSKPSLGIELAEIVGATVLSPEGKQLRTSLVVVTSLVEEGNAWRRASNFEEAATEGAIEPGDTIVAVSDGGGVVTDVEFSGYDQTVSAIAAVTQRSDEVVLVVKRLTRRKVAHVTALLPGGEEREIKCYDGENLRKALLRQGVTAVNDASVQRYDNKGVGNGDCGGQGICATCVVSVLDGTSYLNDRTTTERQLLRKVARWRQSCRARIAIPDGENDAKIRVQLSPRSDL